MMEHTRCRHDHRDSMCSRVSGRMAKVLKNRHIDLVADVDAFIALQVDGEAWN